MNATASTETRTNGTQRAERPAVTPPVNIIESKDGYTLEAEVPGVNKDGVEITVENNELTLVGRRAKVEVRGQALYRESEDADYRRVFELDPAVDTTKITAKVEQGILTVHLPFSERVKPRKITIAE